ncbi:MAG: hypothetical protein ABJA57_04875 [Ginsengibacter sp.]
MEKLIWSFLLQSEKCPLPHIGTLFNKTIPSQLDIANKRILPPFHEINFTENSDNNTHELVNYIALKTNQLPEAAQTELDEYCMGMKKKIENGDRLALATAGSLFKGADGHIYLEKFSDEAYWQPVNAERVVHGDTTHQVLVGDKETTSAEMNRYYEGDVVFERSHWGTWAIILFAIAACLLFFHFNNHPFTTEGVGNQQHFRIADPPVTHDK